MSRNSEFINQVNRVKAMMIEAQASTPPGYSPSTHWSCWAKPQSPKPVFSRPDATGRCHRLPQ